MGDAARSQALADADLTIKALVSAAANEAETELAA
jgi:hypothetical protein